MTQFVERIALSRLGSQKSSTGRRAAGSNAAGTSKAVAILVGTCLVVAASAVGLSAWNTHYMQKHFKPAETNSLELFAKKFQNCVPSNKTAEKFFRVWLINFQKISRINYFQVKNFLRKYSNCASKYEAKLTSCTV